MRYGIRLQDSDRPGEDGWLVWLGELMIFESEAAATAYLATIPNSPTARYEVAPFAEGDAATRMPTITPPQHTDPDPFEVVLPGSRIRAARLPAETDCAECGVSAGRRHKWECPREKCPVCGGQLIMCEFGCGGP